MFRRARASSPRFVSCVALARSSSGHCPARTRLPFVKFFRRTTESRRVATDLIERHQEGVPVEAGIFDTLGLDGPAELLKFHAPSPAGDDVGRRGIRFREQDVPEKKKQCRRHHGIAAPGPVNGEIDRLAIGVREARLADVCPVDRKARDDFENRPAKRR